MGKVCSDGSESILVAGNRKNQMLAAYRANMNRGVASVREMILEDIRRFSDLGAPAYVDDLTEVLSIFDEEGIKSACPQRRSMSLANILHA